MTAPLLSSLIANSFTDPTEVQRQSLVHLNSHIDLVIAAKTG
jgi:superfamily II DNA/RNA helicase